jgi:hypothetical protein
MGRLHELHTELRRRKVYRVAITYAAVAFVVWQVADIAFPSLGLPEASITLVLALTLLGFPLALVLAWAYEMKPEQAPTSATVDSASIEPSWPADTDDGDATDRPHARPIGSGVRRRQVGDDGHLEPCGTDVRGGRNRARDAGR